MVYKLPRSDKRTVIVGSTGSGKTFTAAWILSTRDFHIRPWIIIAYKDDDLLNSLGATEISIFDKPPTKAGLYIVRPIPDRDEGAVEKFLWEVWKNENTGVYTDEGHNLGNRNAALSALLNQGRSKLIEMITLSQRPVWMHKSVFSECNHFYIMRLRLQTDREYVSTYIDGHDVPLLPKYHSLWYDADEGAKAMLAPVPGRDEIIGRFERRLKATNRKIAI
jgi:hypothetical protein